MSLIPYELTGYNASGINMTMVLVLAGIFLINIPFGYWRSNTRRFSLQWMLAVHMPVPAATVLRFWLLGWSWTWLPAFVAAFAAGQYAGGIIRRHMERRQYRLTSSCMVMDMVRVLSNPVRRRD